MAQRKKCGAARKAMKKRGRQAKRAARTPTAKRVTAPHACQSQFGAMPLSDSSFIARTFFLRCSSPIPRRT
jgi:hypothetical protein